MALEPTNSSAHLSPTSDVDSTSAGAPSQVVNIKRERIDPEIENKIKLLKQELKSELNYNSENTGGTNGHGDENRETNESDDDDEDSNDSQSSSQEQNGEEDAPEEDEKKNIQPVKSSNEILTELFQVFNAAPPVELLNDKNLIKKSKKHKKEKKKKRKKQKGEDAEDGELLAVEKSKHKKKKKHKHKNKDGSKEKDKERDKRKIKDKEKSKENKKSKVRDKSKERAKSHERAMSKERAKSRDRAKSKDREKRSKDKDIIKKDALDKYDKPLKSSESKRHHDRDPASDDFSKRRKTDDRDTRARENHFYNGFDKDKEESRTKERSRTKEKNRDTCKESRECDIKIKKEIVERKTQRLSDEGHISDISLSDEETYLKEMEVRPFDYSKRKAHNSFYDGVKRSRSRERERNRDRNHNKEHFHDRDRDNSYGSRGFSRRHHSRYSRSRSRSRSHDLGIDKKRLLEIARKNAISMFKRGNLPGCNNMSQEIKDKVLIKMRYGGRTVEDLTEFCKKISIGENLSDLSSDEDSDVDKTGNTKAFHHPFQLKERDTIVMHIRNSKPILPTIPKSDEQTKAITMQFPVSSGQQHRMTEHWVPVETKDSLAILPSLPAAAPSSSIFKNNLPKNTLGKTLPMAEEQEPAFKPVPATDSEGTSESAANLVEVVSQTPLAMSEIISITIPPPVIVPPPAVVALENNSLTTQFVADVPVPSTNSSIFSRTAGTSLDVSSIISKRLNAMRRLQDNPMDSEALKMMYNSQRDMSSWASSKHLPGQFVGSTGVNVLKPNELHSGPHIWARRDQLTSSKPVTGGMGMHLLQKMGWKPGEGLGREKNGSLQPLLLDVKLDKRGLVAQEDAGGRKQQPGKKRACSITQQQAQQNLEEKHPVCLLNELTSKRKWTPPLYTLVNEKGPSHSKMFLFAVQVNGQSFTPDRASNTKKEAKMVAAKHCLQQIGILPGC